MALASLFWIIKKSEINNPNKGQSEILLNYVMHKLQSVYQGPDNIGFMFQDMLHNIN
jgi:hypothetical protein